MVNSILPRYQTIIPQRPSLIDQLTNTSIPTYPNQPTMNAYEPSLRERIGNWIYDQANKHKLPAHQYRTNTQNAIDFVPGIGDLVGFDDAGADWEAGNKKMAVAGGILSAIGLIPGAGDAVAKGGKTLLKEIADEVPTLSRKIVKAAGDLSMDNASRVKRAKSMGMDFDDPYYHSTTHSFPEFNTEGGNVEGHFGKGSYFTNSTDDLSNYHDEAGYGKDLTNRIEQRADQLAQKLEDQFSEKGRKKVLKSLERSMGDLRFVSAQVADMDDADAAYDAAKVIAKRELHGGSPQSMKVLIDQSNIADTTSTKQVFDLYDEDETDLVNLMDAVKQAFYENDYNAENADNVWGEIANYMFENDDGSLKGLEHAMRNSEAVGYMEHPETGQLSGNQFMADVFKNLGYDGVKMDAFEANKKWRMDGIEYGTNHIIMFDPSKIRSTQAIFDTAKKNSGNIMAGMAGLTAGSAAYLQSSDKANAK